MKAYFSKKVILGVMISVVLLGVVPQNVRAVPILEPIADSFLYGRYPSYYRDYNYGGAWELVISYPYYGLRPLLQFDLSGISNNIEQATLKLYQFWHTGYAADVNVFRLTAPWVEGEGIVQNGDESSSTIGVSWNNNGYGNYWDGGSYDPEISASIRCDEDGWYKWDLTSLVKGWLQEDYPNYGMILISPNGYYRQFYSRNVDWPEDLDKRPQLILHPIPELNTITLFIIGLITIALGRICRGTSCGYLIKM